MKIVFEIFLGVIFAIALFYISLRFSSVILSPTTPQNAENKICFQQNCFYVELAKSESERENGLMNRKKLDSDKGMLFIFEKEAVYPFWMKNTLIPLDIIWINSDNKVVAIKESVQPCKTLICPITDPKVVAKYALEINAGISKKIGLNVGDEANIIIK